MRQAIVLDAIRRLSLLLKSAQHQQSLPTEKNIQFTLPGYTQQDLLNALVRGTSSGGQHRQNALTEELLHPRYQLSRPRGGVEAIKRPMPVEISPRIEDSEHSFYLTPRYTRAYVLNIPPASLFHNKPVARIVYGARRFLADPSAVTLMRDFFKLLGGENVFHPISTVEGVTTEAKFSANGFIEALGTYRDAIGYSGRSGLLGRAFHTLGFVASAPEALLGAIADIFFGQTPRHAVPALLSLVYRNPLGLANVETKVYELFGESLTYPAAIDMPYKTSEILSSIGSLALGGALGILRPASVIVKGVNIGLIGGHAARRLSSVLSMAPPEAIVNNSMVLLMSNQTLPGQPSIWDVLQLAKTKDPNYASYVLRSFVHSLGAWQDKVDYGDKVVEYFLECMRKTFDSVTGKISAAHNIDYIPSSNIVFFAAANPSIVPNSPLSSVVFSYIDRRLLLEKIIDIGLPRDHLLIGNREISGNDFVKGLKAGKLSVEGKEIEFSPQDINGMGSTLIPAMLMTEYIAANVLANNGNAIINGKQEQIISLDEIGKLNLSDRELISSFYRLASYFTVTEIAPIYIEPGKLAYIDPIIGLRREIADDDKRSLDEYKGFLKEAVKFSIYLRWASQVTEIISEDRFYSLKERTADPYAKIPNKVLMDISEAGILARSILFGNNVDVSERFKSIFTNAYSSEDQHTRTVNSIALNKLMDPDSVATMIFRWYVRGGGTLERVEDLLKDETVRSALERVGTYSPVVASAAAEYLKDKTWLESQKAANIGLDIKLGSGGIPSEVKERTDLQSGSPYLPRPTGGNIAALAAAGIIVEAAKNGAYAHPVSIGVTRNSVNNGCAWLFDMDDRRRVAEVLLTVIDIALAAGRLPTYTGAGKFVMGAVQTVYPAASWWTTRTTYTSENVLNLLKGFSGKQSATTLGSLLLAKRRLEEAGN